MQVPFRLLLETRPLLWVYLMKIQAHQKGYLILSKNAWQKLLATLAKLQNTMTDRHIVNDCVDDMLEKWSEVDKVSVSSFEKMS